MFALIRLALVLIGMTLFGAACKTPGDQIFMAAAGGALISLAVFLPGRDR